MNVALVAAFVAATLAGCLGEPPSPPFGEGNPDVLPTGAEAFLAPRGYTRIWVDLDVDDNATPPQALGETLGLLASLASKTVDGGQPSTVDLPGGNHSLADLLTLAAKHRDPAPDNATLVLHILVLRGNHTNPLGVTSALTPVGGSTVFVFPDGMAARWREGAASAEVAGWQPWHLESAVLAHEMGHLLGLVGCGVDAEPGHEDPGSDCHSANVSSVMSARVAHVALWPPRTKDSCFGPFNFDAEDLAAIDRAWWTCPRT